MTHSVICVFVLAKKKKQKNLYNRNVRLTKPVKVLYQQKLVYLDWLKTKLS